MGCSVRDELQFEWRWLVYHDPGTSFGVDSPSVKAFWEMIEHDRSCPNCRNEGGAVESLVPAIET